MTSEARADASFARLALAALAALPALLGAGCEGAVLDVGDDPPLAAAPETSCEIASPATRTRASTGELERSLTGRWRRICGTASGVLFPEGLEIAPPEWFTLAATATGELTRVGEDARRGQLAVSPPVSVTLVARNLSRQTLVVLFDDDDSHMRVVRSAFDAVDVRYVRER